MAIATLDGYIGAPKYKLTWMKTGTRTLVAAMPYTVFDIAGNPGAGTLNVGNTANGLVHDDTIAGYPAIPSFGGQAGYVSRVEYGSSVPCWLDIYDRLFVAGAYAYNADVSLASQPDFSGRLPNAGIYNGLQLWIEAVTAFTGSLSVQINYLDQDGGAGDTGAVATLALPIGRMYQIPLAVGDSGIRQIDRVRGTVATAGTFNVMILRPLWCGRVPVANSGDVHDLLRTGLPKIFDTSALYTILSCDSTAVGLPDASIEVAVG